MRILLAPDKFKGSLSSTEAIDVMRRAILDRQPSFEVVGLAMADGGDGTLAAVLDHGYSLRRWPTVDALGRPCIGAFARRGDEALVELAGVCGLASVLDLPRRPFEASTLGLGLIARQAINEGAREILVALGGSASIDGGLGFLMGLGFEVTNSSGRPVAPGLGGLADAMHLDLGSPPRAVMECRWRFLTDVDSPLLGPSGAACVFGSQKGLDAADLARAEQLLQGWTRLLRSRDRDLERLPGMGAAGGVAYAGAVVLGATVGSGAAWVADRVGLDDAIRWADMVVTGEGAFDEQSFARKAPNEVIVRSIAQGKHVYVVAGSVAVTEADLRRRGIAGAVALSGLAGSVDAAQHDPVTWLTEATANLLSARVGEAQICAKNSNKRFS